MSMSEKVRHWLILSHCYNMDGRAASQLITPRIPLLKDLGCSCSVISAPNGEHDPKPHSHHRVFSPFPSGLRFELRYYIRREITIPLLRNALLFSVSFFLLPFYLLEKLFIRLESQWSWFLTVYLRALLLFRGNEKFEIIYSTGGPFSSHIAAIFLSKTFGIPCMCEIQDPIVFDSPYWKPRGRSVFVYSQIEKFICQNADAMVFLTQTARKKALARTKTKNANFHSIYSGATQITKKSPQPKARTALKLEIAHFGSLAGSRNLNALFSGLLSIFNKKPHLKELIRISLYGNLDKSVLRSIEEFPHKESISIKGFISHQLATEHMQEVDVLLLIQDDSYVASETIPSKAYEYFHSGKSVFAIVHNEELLQMLKSYNCYSAEISKPESIEECLLDLFHSFSENNLRIPKGEFPAQIQSVRQIQKIANTLRLKKEKIL